MSREDPERTLGLVGFWHGFLAFSVDTGFWNIMIPAD